MFKRHAIAAVALMMLCLCGTVTADSGRSKTNFVIPEQKIEGAENKFEVGDLVVLTISQPTTPPQWLVSTAYTWRVRDRGVLKKVKETNGEIFFGTGSTHRTINVECIITLLFIVTNDKKEILEVATRTTVADAVVTIGNPPPAPPIPIPPGPGPGPGPAPTPDPPAPPTFPDGEFKLAAASWNTATLNVTDRTARVKGAAALAPAFRGIASAIVAGSIKDLSDGLQKTKLATDAALLAASVDRGQWNEYGNVMQQLTLALYKAKKLNTVNDLATAWNEIANGLDKVK